MLVKFCMIAFILHDFWVSSFLINFDPYRNRVYLSSLTRDDNSLKVETFERFSKEKGIIKKEIKHANFKFVRGLNSETLISAGDPIVVLPIESSLFVSEKGDIDPPTDFVAVWPSLSGVARLATLLLKEWKAGSSSKFYAYIDFLPSPEEYLTPIHWSSDLLETFPYQPLVRSVNAQQNRLKKLHALITSTNTDFVSYERFVWAMEVVMSRAFQGISGINGLGKLSSLLKWSPIISGLLIASAFFSAIFIQSTQKEIISELLGTLAMLSLLPVVLQSQSSISSDDSNTSCVLLPVIDSCNHNSGNPSCEMSLEPFLNSFVLRSKRDLKAGEEFTISYGNKTNDYLFQYFGFVEDKNQFDVYVINNTPAKLYKLLSNKPEYSNLATSLLRYCSSDQLDTTSLGTSNTDLTLNSCNKKLWNVSLLENIVKDSSNTINKSNDINNDKILSNCLQLLILSELSTIQTFISTNANTNISPYGKEAIHFLKLKCDILQKTLLLL